MALVDLLVPVLLVGAAFFALVAAVGIVRLPDVYARIHAVSKSETLGAILALSAVTITLGTDVGAIKATILLLFLFLTNPTAAHAVARAADDQGIEPWTPEDDEESSTTSQGGEPS